MTRRSRSRLAVVAVTLATSLGLACASSVGDRSGPPALVRGGDPDVGRELVEDYGCGSCHRVPGVRRADALVGPPLDAWSRRSFIAGTLPNSQQNLTRWLRDPQQVRPGSAMPDLDIDDADLADIVAYLFTLD
jgi:cytochrome c